MGNYTLGEMIGKGGMGTVYRAHHTGLDRDVAVKFIHQHLTEDDEIVERFLREARLAARIDHPNVVHIYDTGTDDGGGPFIVMEFLDGESLRQRLKRGKIPEREAVEIAAQVLDGLQEAHDQGVVHRDIKPGNIFITSRGRVKIVDFGVAKGLGGNRLTGTGMQIGTPEYMSPEQIEGSGVDGRSDLYSLGIVLYEMLTGEVPFKSDTPVGVLYKHVHVAPALSGGLCSSKVLQVLTTMLQKDVAQRFSSAKVARSALLGQVPVPHSPSVAAPVLSTASTPVAAPAPGGTEPPQRPAAMGGGQRSSGTQDRAGIILGLVTLGLVFVIVIGVMIGGSCNKDNDTASPPVTDMPKPDTNTSTEPGAAPQDDGAEPAKAAPKTGYAGPKPGDGAEPGKAAPKTDYAAPKPGNGAEPGKAAPKTGDGAPKTDDATPKTDDAAPKTDDAAPKTGDGAPKTDDAGSKTGDGSGKTDDAGSKTGDGAGKTGDAPQAPCTTPLLEREAK